MSKPRVLTSEFVPPPIDGLNLVTPPPMMRTTEALELLNYYIYDHGIRQVNEATLENTFDEPIGSIYPYIASTGGGFLMVFTSTKSHLWNVETGVVVSTETGLNGSDWNVNEFNDKIFSYSNTGVDTPQVNAGSSMTSAGWTGPADPKNLCQGWNYKFRQYAIERGTSSVWYVSGAAGVGAITGALTELDLSTSMITTSTLLFGAAWSYNQGLSNDELFVLVWANGDIAIYSGDNPDAANWTLVTRSSIPRPLSRKSFTKVGQDILIATNRGTVSLKAVFAGSPGRGSDYYITSRNLGGVAFGSTEVAFNRDAPFLYFSQALEAGVSFATGGIFVLNYERGAWSKIGFPGIDTCTAIAWAPIGNTGGLFFVGDNDGKLYAVGDYGAEDVVLGAGDTMQYRWKTPFLDFGTNLTKHSKFIRLLVRVKDATSDTARATVYPYTDFEAVDDFDSASEAVTVTAGTDTYSTLELSAGNVGKRLGYHFLQTGDGEINEIIGFDAFYEVGGCE